MLRRNHFIVALVAGLFTFSARAEWLLVKTKGQVEIERKGTKLALTEKQPLALKSADLIVTGEDGLAHLQDVDSAIWIGSSSRVQMHKLLDPQKDDRGGRIDLIIGKARVRFKRPSGPEEFPYQVRLKSVVASVRGTEFFVAVEGKKAERVSTFEGLVRVTSLGSSSEIWDVPAGKGLLVLPHEMPKVRESTAEQTDTWRKATDF